MIRHVTRPCPCMTTSIIIKITRVISMWTPHWITVSCHGVEGPMTTGYYCAIFPFCGGGQKKTKKQRHFITGLPQVSSKNGNWLEETRRLSRGKTRATLFFFIWLVEEVTLVSWPITERSIVKLDFLRQSDRIVFENRTREYSLATNDYFCFSKFTLAFPM